MELSKQVRAAPCRIEVPQNLKAEFFANFEFFGALTAG